MTVDFNCYGFPDVGNGGGYLDITKTLRIFEMMQSNSTRISTNDEKKSGQINTSRRWHHMSRRKSKDCNVQHVFIACSSPV